MAGTLFVVATPIGNLEDISARAIRVLREVALIAAEDTRRTSHLLQRFGLTTRTISFHEHSEKGKTSDLLERLAAGDSIALVSDAGTPAISDPGEHLIQLAHQAGIRVEPVPGPSAAVSAVSVSGFASSGFAFLGFPPTKLKERRSWMERVRAAAGCVSAVVFYESPHRIVSTLDELRASLGDIEVLVARELTKAHEEVRLGTLGSIKPGLARGEFTVVLNVGQIPATNTPAVGLTSSSAGSEFGELTEQQGLTRRQAITTLARRYGLSAREVYRLVEEGKKSGV